MRLSAPALLALVITMAASLAAAPFHDAPASQPDAELGVISRLDDEERQRVIARCQTDSVPLEILPFDQDHDLPRLRRYRDVELTGIMVEHVGWPKMIGLDPSGACMLVMLQKKGPSGSTVKKCPKKPLDVKQLHSGEHPLHGILDVLADLELVDDGRYIWEITITDWCSPLADPYTPLPRISVDTYRSAILAAVQGLMEAYERGFHLSKYEACSGLYSVPVSQSEGRTGHRVKLHPKVLRAGGHPNHQNDITELMGCFQRLKERLDVQEGEEPMAEEVRDLARQIATGKISLEDAMASEVIQAEVAAHSELYPELRRRRIKAAASAESA